MLTNPILTELHEIRREYVERFNHDRHAICEDARRKQGQEGRQVVTATPRPPITYEKTAHARNVSQLDLTEKPSRIAPGIFANLAR